LEIKNAAKQKLIEAFSLPAEVMMDLPVLHMTGNTEFYIENYKNILEFTEAQIKMNTKGGVVKIAGSRLCLTHISRDGVRVKGRITCVEFC
jgi:sporulation protein YqfC